MPNRLRMARRLLSTSFLVILACEGTRPNLSPENTPPTVTFVTAPPAYTRVPSLTITVMATDTLGVGAVYVLVGSLQSKATELGEGSWQVTVSLPVAGHNSVTVWAEDKGSPTANSGRGMGAPYELTVDVVYDPNSPLVEYDGTYASYSDERTLELAVDPSGLAVTPAQYVVGAKAPIAAGGDIYKASTRLAGGASMNPSELESTNAANIPVLRFMVPLDKGTAAPIETATYVAEVTCSQACAGAGGNTGSLFRSATTSTTATLFDLPVSTETIPGLAAIQGAGTLSISVTVTDAAGNSATSSGFNFLFHVIGPPLALVEDRNYPSQEATNSIYGPYHLSDNTYANLWMNLQNFVGGQVRLLRYLITNPTDQPIALQVSYAQDPSGSWRVYEDWNAYELPDPRGLTTSGTVVLDSPWQSVPILIDRFTYYNTMYWAIPYGTVGTLAGGESGAIPCVNPSTNWLMHRMGDTQNKFVCKTAIGYPGPANANGAYSTSDVGTDLNQAVAALSGEEHPADRDSTGQWYLVPAAAGALPGTLVLYLTRPNTAPRTRALQWNAYMSKAPVVNHYQTWDYVIWDAYQHGQTPYTLYPGYDSYVANRAGNYLTYATDQLFGSLTGTTHAYLSATLVGESTARVTVTLARQSLTTH